MVGGIRRDLLLELADRSDRLRLLGELDRSAHRRHRSIVALGFRHLGQRLLGLFDRAVRHIGARQTRERRHVGGIVGQQLAVNLGGGREILLRQRLVGGFQQIFFFAADRALGQAIEERDHLAFGERAHEAVGRLAVDEGDHRRDRLDAHLARNRRMLVDVHLDQLDLALGRLDHLLQHGRELLARPAPRRPEVDQHRLALRLLDHILHEALGGGLLDETLRGCGCGRGPAALQHRHQRSSPGIPAGVRSAPDRLVPGINGPRPRQMQRANCNGASPRPMGPDR
jgi:hypothetical protein